jgi:hypothetical protein
MSERGYPGNGRIIKRKPPMAAGSDPLPLVRHYGHVGLNLIPMQEAAESQVRWIVDPTVFVRGEYPDIEREIRQFLAGLNDGIGFVVEITDGSYAGDCVNDLYWEAAIIALEQAVAGLRADGGS